MNDQLISILHKSINGVGLTDIEKKELNDWIGQSQHNRDLYDEIMNSEAFRQDIKKMLNYDGKPIWNKISKELYPSQYKSNTPVFRKRFFRYAAAAALLICISTTVYMLFVKPTTHQEEAVSKMPPLKVPDLPAGTEKATLTLDDGTVLVLDNTSNGKIAEQGNTIIVKEDGLLAYNPDNWKSSTNVFYNTITAPRAGYYSSLVLADGSKVWLNSLSSIRFPTAFTGKERVVEVTGEVYFEVAKNAAKPFKVNVKDKGMMVEVLGTHFNINAYNDEATIKTTLLEGAVKIVAGGKASFLKPDQQASLNKNGEITIADDADLEKIVAWKNGIFSFKKDDMETIMREVSRWYGVEVVFEDKIPEHFVATVSRNVPVSKLLKILKEMAGGEVQFEIDEAQKKIIVRH